MHFWVGAHHTFQQMLQINGKSLGWPKKYLVCSRCGAGVGHASKPNSIPLAAGMSLQVSRCGGWSYSPAQLCRHLLTGRAGGQGSLSPPSLSVTEVSTDLCQTEHLLTLPRPFAFGLCQNQTNCYSQVVIQQECFTSRGKQFSNWKKQNFSMAYWWLTSL